MILNYAVVTLHTILTTILVMLTTHTQNSVHTTLYAVCFKHDPVIPETDPSSQVVQTENPPDFTLSGGTQQEPTTCPCG